MISIICGAPCGLGNAEGARQRFQGYQHLSIRPHAAWLATCPGTFSVSPADIMLPCTSSARYAFFSLCPSPPGGSNPFTRAFFPPSR